MMMSTGLLIQIHTHINAAPWPPDSSSQGSESPQAAAGSWQPRPVWGSTVQNSSQNSGAQKMAGFLLVSPLNPSKQETTIPRNTHFGRALGVSVPFQVGLNGSQPQTAHFLGLRPPSGIPIDENQGLIKPWLQGFPLKWGHFPININPPDVVCVLK